MRMMTIIMMMTIWQSPTTQSIWPSEKISATTSHHRKFQLLQLLRHWTKGEPPLLLPSKWRQHIRILEGNKNPLKTLNGIYYIEYVKDISFWHYVLLWVIKCLLLIFPLQFLFWCTLRTLWEFSQTQKFLKFTNISGNLLTIGNLFVFLLQSFEDYKEYILTPDPRT